MRLINADTLIALLASEIDACRNDLADPDTDPEVIALLKVKEQVETLAKRGIEEAAVPTVVDDAYDDWLAHGDLPLPPLAEREPPRW